MGLDEVDPQRGYVSWVSPIARALTKNSEGDVVALRTPGGIEELEILAVEYKALDTHLAPSHLQLSENPGAAVSYTHLEGYKRQPQAPESMPTGRGCTVKRMPHRSLVA